MSVESKDVRKSQKTNEKNIGASSKNYILQADEIRMLTNAVIERFAAETGGEAKAIEKKFNSNQKNYASLYEKVNSMQRPGISEGLLRAIGIKSNKPFASLFYFSAFSDDGSQTFRKGFIEVLYQYAFEKSRTEYLRDTEGAYLTSTTKMFNRISGCWECYYDRFGDFMTRFHDDPKTRLDRIAFQITGSRMDDAQFVFYQPNKFGRGRVTYNNTNLIFCSSMNDLVLILNCGDLHNVKHTVQLAVGCYTHIDDLLSPKIGRCVLYHIDEKDFDTFRNTFISMEYLKTEVGSREREATKYFSKFFVNCITANLNAYRTVIII